MRTGLNILWFICGGAIAALAWALAALIMAVSIIGLPWARGCFEIAAMSLHPFGRDIVTVEALRGRDDPFGSVVGFICNLLWLPLGILLAVIHLAHAVALALTIIGIPCALQHVKLAGISFSPVGKRVVLNEVASAARLAAYRR